MEENVRKFKKSLKGNYSEIWDIIFEDIRGMFEGNIRKICKSLRWLYTLVESLERSVMVAGKFRGGMGKTVEEFDGHLLENIEKIRSERRITRNWREICALMKETD